MYFETPPGISKEAIALLMTEIQHAQQIEDHIEKKEKVAEIK